MRLSYDDAPTSQLLTESIDEVNRCTWLLFGEAKTYADLCEAAKRSIELIRGYERSREEAWMTNLDRVLGTHGYTRRS